ncbi:MAG: pyridoxamine 5'-phosphate oxidase family protein [Chloroherpetonaceae bacterium]|nr:pyridoxamine 5'-phosphate oxidase family protein [Chloroherpetonaceae bacterium]
MFEISTLERVLEQSWTLLKLGASKRNHPMHLGVFCTKSENGVAARTVVLRKVEPEERLIIFHTDIRSSKISEIKSSPDVAWLFYDPELQIQLRFTAKAEIHLSGERANEHWQKTQLTSRRCYITEHPPLYPVSEPVSGLKKHLIGRIPTADESEEGRENFSVVVTKAMKLDWLYLDSAGHKRAVFDWQSGQMQANWVIP